MKNPSNLNTIFVKKTVLKISTIYGKLTYFLGITFIEIPYEWDRSVDSLRSIIQEHRPELFSSIAPIKAQQHQSSGELL